MSELAEVLGNEGVPFEIKHNGKVFKARLIDQTVKDAFSKKMLTEAVDIAIQLKRAMTESKYQEHLLKINTEYLVGEYDMLSPKGLKKLQTQSGILMLCGMLFNLNDMEMIKLLLEKKTEVLTLLDTILKLSFPIPIAITGVPNSDAPVVISSGADSNPPVPVQ